MDIQDEFPFQSSTAEIKRLLPQIRKARGAKNYDIEMQLAQFELNSRAAARTGWIALGVAGVALLVSIVFGSITAHYARAALESSQQWEQKQLAALEQLRQDGAALRNALEQLEAKPAASPPARAAKAPRAGAAGR